MRLLQKAVIEAEGGYLYGSEIFYHESCIYMDVLMELLEEGYEVWQCYDAWYAAKDGVTQEEFEAHVTEVVAQKAEEYMEADEYIRRKQISKESDRGLRHNVMILLNALYERMNNNSKMDCTQRQRQKRAPNRKVRGFLCGGQEPPAGQGRLCLP